jgi:hypothetical protein
MAYWLNDAFWACDKHTSGARMSASSKVCWYGCGTVRPSKEVTAAAIRAQKNRTMDLKPSVPSVEITPVRNTDGPTPQEKRRGATQRVKCSECGKVLWRRPKDAALCTTFFCSTEHRSMFARKARS